MGARNELPIPNGAIVDAGSVEVLRAWIVDQGLQVSMAEVFHNPGMWGILVVDIARHAARALAGENVCTEDEAMREIRRIIEAELDQPTDSGTTQPMKKQ